MSFTIKLQQNNSRDNARNKALTDVLTLTGTLKEESSMLDPDILIETTTDISRCNYLTIEVFQRYYFIKEITVVNNNRYRIKAHCDVLSSAGSGLNSCMGIVRRQQNAWNLYLDDGVFKAYSNPLIVTKEFPSGFSTQSLALAVAGS